MDKKTIFMRYVSNTPAVVEPEWHEVFSGSKTIACGGTGTTNWITGLPSNVQKFRATGQVKLEATRSGTASVKFTLADNTQTYYKEAAYGYTHTYTFTDIEFMKIYQYSPASYSTTIAFDSATGALQIKLVGGNSYGYSGNIVIKKIEALY